MSQDQLSQSSTELVLKEIEVNDYLKSWQDAINRGEKMPAKNNACREFFNSLYLLPKTFRSIILKIRFDPRDSRMSKYQNYFKNLKLSSIDQEGLTYLLHILTPRKTPMNDIPGTHGSLHRDRYFAVGEIKTMQPDMDRDPETKDDTSIQINPANIGALSTDQSFGKYWVFPRQIEKIELSIELPLYLRPEQVNFVNDFYSFSPKNP